MNNNTPNTNTGDGGGRNKEEKDTNTPPTLATTRASPEREGKSRKRTPRKADQQKRRRWGGGRTNPWKPEKDTKDLTQPSLPGDATDQPNPNTKTQYREGPKGDKQVTTRKECSKHAQYLKLSMTCVTQSVNCIHSSSQLRHLQLQHSCETSTAVSTTKKRFKRRRPVRPSVAFMVRDCGVSLWQLQQNARVATVRKSENRTISFPTLTTFQQALPKTKRKTTNPFFLLRRITILKLSIPKPCRVGDAPW